MISAPFRFDAENHSYIALDTGEVIPSITQLIKAAGLVDDRYYTEESRHRGTVVHQLTADYDLGALDSSRVTSPYRGYLLAHVKAMDTIRPTWEHIEVAAVHPTLRFAGRLDRAGTIYGASSLLDEKTGVPCPSHALQTALQAILAAPTFHLPPEALQRYTLYLKADGRFSLEHHTNTSSDLRKAREILKEFAR